LVDGNQIGVVQVCNDYSDLHVTYVINDTDWCMTKTNLDVADSLAGIPQNPHGKPLTGRFDYKNEHHPCAENFGVTIALGDWAGQDPPTVLYIAANATVSDRGGTDPKAMLGVMAQPSRMRAERPTSLTRSRSSQLHAHM
jgi:hypothetical protein